MNDATQFFDTAAGGGGYQIERSLRFNSSDSAYLSRTPASAGNRKTWTISTWLKRASLTGNNFLLRISGTDDATYLDAWINSSGQLFISGYYSYWIQSVPVYRDPSAWYHLVIAANTTAAVASERFKVYVNGVYVTGNYNVAPTLNSDLAWNRSAQHNICGGAGVAGDFLLADFHSIDGQALTPTSFGEFDTNNVWQPKAYAGTYGTNGFHLPFSDNSTTAALGTDTSGAGNNWTVNNISVAAGAGNDSLVDTPTNYGTDTGAGGEVRGNYCTLNPLVAGDYSNAALSNGNLDAVFSTNTIAASTWQLESGKWYYEVTATSAPAAGSTLVRGVEDYKTAYTSFSWRSDTGATTGLTGSPTFSTYSNGDVLGVAIDIDNSQAAFYKNGVQQGTGFYPYSTFSITALIVSSYGFGAFNASFNFGQRAFAYPAPSGFKALCTTNLPAPLVAKPSEVMDVALYTGNGSTQTISGLGFSPDLVWIKNRAAADNHKLLDTIRGATNELESNTTDAEIANADGLTAFNSDGFDLGADVEYNTSSETYVAWTWDAGSSTVTNTDGSITSQVRANASAGFSIVTYTGTGSVATIGHGLGVAPQLVITKCRGASSSWGVYHASLGATGYLRLELANAFSTGTGPWNDTAPTSTVFTVGTNPATNTANTMVAYCFASVAGYSSFGSYTGNGSADGPFVYTGFRPRWILIKTTAAISGNWYILDTARDAYNVMPLDLYANDPAAESTVTTNQLDALSNGFKLRGTGGGMNGSGHTLIYAAFAENPFKTARAR